MLQTSWISKFAWMLLQSIWSTVLSSTHGFETMIMCVIKTETALIRINLNHINFNECAPNMVSCHRFDFTIEKISLWNPSFCGQSEFWMDETLYNVQCIIISMVIIKLHDPGYILGVENKTNRKLLIWTLNDLHVEKNAPFFQRKFNINYIGEIKLYWIGS